MIFNCNFVTVKGIFVISAVVILFLQSVNMSLTDLFRIPDLVEHYTEHQAKGDSLLSFISKHYGLEKAAHQSEDSEHEDLPFHHTVQMSAEVQLLPELLAEVSPLLEDGIYHCFHYVSPATRLGEHKINHPPQLFC